MVVCFEMNTNLKNAFLLQILKIKAAGNPGWQKIVAPPDKTAPVTWRDLREKKEPRTTAMMNEGKIIECNPVLVWVRAALMVHLNEHFDEVTSGDFGGRSDALMLFWYALAASRPALLRDFPLFCGMKLTLSKLQQSRLAFNLSLPSRYKTLFNEWTEKRLKNQLSLYAQKKTYEWLREQFFFAYPGREWVCVSLCVSLMHYAFLYTVFARVHIHFFFLLFFL